MKSKKLPKQIQSALTDDETVERSFNLKGCKVYATSKRLLELTGRTVRDYDYTHVSSIAYSSKRYWALLVFGIIAVIAGIYSFGDTDGTIFWVLIGIGCFLIILGVFRKSEWVEVNIVGVQNTVEYKGSRDELDSLLQIVRQKRLTESTSDNKGSKGIDYIETIRKLAELRDEGIITQDEFEEKKHRILQNSE
ncbi:SHOCT domain-containing protein [Chloroflexota bacterium]